MVRRTFWCAVAAVLVLTLVPGHYLPQKGPFNFWDKAQHALAFGGLTALGLWVWRTGPQRAHLLIGLVALGGAIEVAQHLTGWRQGQWADWGADSLGVGLISLTWHLSYGYMNGKGPRMRALIDTWRSGRDSNPRPPA